jgi:iron(III) transport system ATP-binding protein
MTEMIGLTDLSRRFGGVAAVDGVDLTVARGEFVALLGPSGCGKTTLLRLVAGFERPDAGEVRVAGRVVAGSGSWMPPERRGVGIVFQHYALFPHLTVAENVGFGLSRRERRGRVEAGLGLVGLHGLADRYPHQLSGGQQQRVALARTLAPQPSVVLLDEPWSNIDPLLRGSMREELAEILRASGATVVLVTHDREEAFSLADRIAVMDAGRIAQVGAAEELYFTPASHWVAQFVGAANLVPGRVSGARVETPLGTFPVQRPPADSDVEVLVRPELLALRAHPDGAAEVIGREFRGHDVFYRLRLADGSVVCSQRPSTEDVPLGTRVTLEAHEGPVALLPARL